MSSIGRRADTATASIVPFLPPTAERIAHRRDAISFRRVLGERPYRLGMCDVNKGQVIVDGVGSAYCTHRIKIRISPEHMSNRAARNFTMQVAFSTPRARARRMTVQLTGVLCGVEGARACHPTLPAVKRPA